MNSGLSNLATLKAWLLPESMRLNDDYDAQILAIGLGMSGLLERHCHRQFARAIGATHECSADRAHVVLPRYPVEAVTKVEIRRNLTEGWVELTDVVENQNLAAGLLLFGSELGSWGERLRLTYTGGYWWRTAEPADTGYAADTLPTGATALPDDLQLAWRLQCELAWSKRDNLGLSIGEKPDNVSVGSLSRIQLTDGVKDMLRPYVRLSLS